MANICSEMLACEGIRLGLYKEASPCTRLWLWWPAFTPGHNMLLVGTNGTCRVIADYIKYAWTKGLKMACFLRSPTLRTVFSISVSVSHTCLL